MKPELDEFHYHEMLDRISLILNVIDTHLHQHPVAKLESEVSEKIEEAHLKLWDAYQTIGKIRHDKFNGVDARN
jgi:hypothetical protein